jgi:peptidyl-prolyl cis-trans isomerase B (cyclophilin B)
MAANPIARIQTQYGVMIAELYPEHAPATAANFVKLAKSGFYDGLIFHRVIPGFMIQGGDPDGDGTGGPGWTIPGEFSGNGHANNLKHTRGVLSMARTNDPDSAGSQFFIMTDDASYLDGKYAAFGKLTSGFEVLDSVAAVPTNSGDRPLDDQIITTVRVENV